MDEDESFLKKVYSLTPLMQERVDRILLAVARRAWELRRDTTPAGALPVQHQWQAEAVRSSPLGHHLLLIARYVDRNYFSPDQGQVELAMQHLLRMVFGNPFDQGYRLPAQFHTTELGELFHQAYSKMSSHEDLLTVKQAYEEVGVARQSVYDRITDGKLHPIYFSGDIRLLRSEIEEWKAQRNARNKTQA